MNGLVQIGRHNSIFMALDQTEMTHLWLFTSDTDISGDYDELLAMANYIGLKNTTEYGLDESKLQQSSWPISLPYMRLPPNFRLLQLALPDHGFAPDYFHHGSYQIVSRRFRDALAQPDEVVQFCPIELLRGGKQVRAQDYQLMRVIAHQPAMDLERSDCDIEERTNQITGLRRRQVIFLRQMMLLPDVKPRTEIFRIDEDRTSILVTDALALRVLAAGCTGAEFSHPENLQWAKGVERYRTLDGIAERRVGFVD